MNCSGCDTPMTDEEIHYYAVDGIGFCECCTRAMDAYRETEK